MCGTFILPLTFVCCDPMLSNISIGWLSFAPSSKVICMLTSIFQWVLILQNKCPYTLPFAAGSSLLGFTSSLCSQSNCRRWKRHRRASNCALARRGSQHSSLRSRVRLLRSARVNFAAGFWLPVAPAPPQRQEEFWAGTLSFLGCSAKSCPSSFAICFTSLFHSQSGTYDWAASFHCIPEPRFSLFKITPNRT